MRETLMRAIRRFVDTYKPKPDRMAHVDRLEQRLNAAEARLNARLEAYGYAVDNVDDRRGR